MCLQVYLALVFLTLILSYMIYERIRLFQLFTRLGIPGPCPNFFVGNMMELMGNGKLVTDVMAEWEAQFGLVYGYFRGTRATLVVRDSELIKDILVRNSSEFINRPHMVITVPPLASTLVGLRGQRWKEVRTYLSPTFSSAKIKQMLPIMSNCVQTTVEILKEKCKSGGDSGDDVVDAHRLFQGLACDVISGCALAMKVNAQRDENDRFFRAVRGFLDNAMGPFVKIALCFPLLASMMGWALETFGYSHEMTKMIMENVQTAMKMRRDKHSTSGSVPVDALQLMMDARDCSKCLGLHFR
ncbi:Cytochrome P450 3A6 [Orchesella cincta]|uniref:Cytochrome P450 3A6 n=1 Tax=Orchesella cincta TaxID=48709 RepID=A0A1D2MZW0_ORCCI|nr:Cytochrome P450 3A6 [Orchesella cincta]